MASILQIGASWRVQIRRSGRKSISKTFPTKAKAEAWARQHEVSADVLAERITIAELIDEYRKARKQTGREIDDTANEHYMLNHLADGLGKIPAAGLTTKHLVDWAASRKAMGAGPYAINMEVSKLGTVYRMMRSLLALKLGDPVGDARPTLAHFQLIGGGGKRNRRPTADELQRLFAWFDANKSRRRVPMEDIIRVAITIGLRRGELFRVTWADLDESKRVVIVRDRKHPRQKKGNDQRVPLLGESFDIVMRQPRTDDPRIFPFEGGTVSKYFTEACRALNIPDLHLHDMRHEAHSALVEAGWHPLEIKAVTGNSPKQQETYVNLDPAKLHEKVVPISKAKKRA